MTHGSGSFEDCVSKNEFQLNRATMLQNILVATVVVLQTFLSICENCVLKVWGNFWLFLETCTCSLRLSNFWRMKNLQREREREMFFLRYALRRKFLRRKISFLEVLRRMILSIVLRTVFRNGFGILE